MTLSCLLFLTSIRCAHYLALPCFNAGQPHEVGSYDNEEEEEEPVFNPFSSEIEDLGSTSGTKVTKPQNSSKNEDQENPQNSPEKKKKHEDQETTGPKASDGSKNVKKPTVNENFLQSEFLLFLLIITTLVLTGTEPRVLIRGARP